MNLPVRTTFFRHDNNQEKEDDDYLKTMLSIIRNKRSSSPATLVRSIPKLVSFKKTWILSKKFSDCPQRYARIEKEATAVKFAIDRW